eukprot:768135-Hanusia_phi.AAC.1
MQVKDSLRQLLTNFQQSSWAFQMTPMLMSKRLMPSCLFERSLRTSSVYHTVPVTRSISSRRFAARVQMSSIAGNHPIFTDSPKLAVRQSSTAPKEWKGDLLLLPFPEVGGEDKKALVSLAGVSAELDAATEGLVSDLVKENEFKGKAGSSVLTRLAKSSSFKRLSLVGMGNISQATMASGYALGKQIASAAKSEKAKTAAVVVPEGLDSTAVKAMVQVRAT